jgi:inorganic pyrophosphatase
VGSARGAIRLDRFLFSSVVYPTDYGFIPDTLAQDGDPLDAMACVSEPTFPGCLIPVKPIALFKMRDDKGVDDKVLCVPLQDPNWNGIEPLEDLSLQLRDEISHFSSIYKTPEGTPGRAGTCDLDGSPLARRDDDEPTTIRRRLAVYHDQTEPLIAHYEAQQGLRRVDGKGDPSEIRHRLAVAISAPSDSHP